MVQLLRLSHLVLLCAALISGSVSMAVARGQAIALTHGGTMIVICTGYGVMTLALDDRDNPVGPVHPCPDCLAGLAAYLLPGPVVIVPISLPSERAVLVAAGLRLRASLGLITRARGPPAIG